MCVSDKEEAMRKEVIAVNNYTSFAAIILLSTDLTVLTGLENVSAVCRV